MNIEIMSAQLHRKSCITVNVLKFWSLFSFCLVNEMLIIMVGIHKMHVPIPNREDPDQTASSEAIWSGSALFV